jgi:hypothetical protein
MRTFTQPGCFIGKVLKMMDVVALFDAREVPAVRGPYKKQNAEISN